MTAVLVTVEIVLATVVGAAVVATGGHAVAVGVIDGETSVD